MSSHTPKDETIQMQTVLKDTDVMLLHFELRTRSVLICLGVSDLFKN